MTAHPDSSRDEETGERDQLQPGGHRADTRVQFHDSVAGEHPPTPTTQEKFVKRTSGTPTNDRPFDRTLSSRSGSKGSLGSVRTRLSMVSRSEYHQDLKPDLTTGLTFNVILAVFTIVFGSSFQFGYNIGVLNQPQELIVEFYNHTYTVRRGYISSAGVEFLYSLTSALFIPGGMLGAVLGGFLADKAGRKRAILFSHSFVFSGALLCTFCLVTKSPELLMIGRFLLGVNSGIGNCIAPMYLQEIAPYNNKGAFGTTHQLFITLGICVSSILGLQQLLGTATRWPFLLLVMVVPAIFSLCVLPFLPDSPRYLLLVRCDRKAAEKSLQFYRKVDNVSADMEEMDTEHLHKSSTEVYTLTDLAHSRDLRGPLLVACMLQVIQQFSGINSIVMYSATIFTDANVPKEQIPYAVIGTNAVNVCMTVISVMLMDRAGRRLLLLIPMVVMIADLVVITISLNLPYDWMAYLSVCCVIIYVIAFAIGLGPIPMMVASEFFRQGPRPAAMTLAGITNWVATFVIVIGFQNVQNHTKTYTFLIFLILMVAFTIFIYFKVPETKNKTFEEIAHAYAPGGEIEVEEVLDEVVDPREVAALPPLSERDISEQKLVTLNFKPSSSPPPAPESIELLTTHS